MQAEDVLHTYPAYLLGKAASDSDRSARLEDFRQATVKVKSVCTGIDAAGEAFRLLQLCQQPVEQGIELLPEHAWVVSSSWCDIGRPQQGFLKQRASERAEGMRPCLFTSIQEQLPRALQKELGLLVDRSKHSKEQMKSFHKELALELKQRQDEAFDTDCTAPCLVHQKACRVQQTRSCGSQTPPKEVLMSAGGLPCVAFSRVGLQEKDAHVSEAAFQAWIAERRYLAATGREDFFFFENVQNYPISKVTDPLAQTHKLVVLPFSPQDCAECCARSVF